MNTCIVLFSHADNKEKKETLKKTVDSLKEFNLPILLSSNITVDDEIINNVNHFIYNKKNILFKESDFIDLYSPVTEANYNSQYTFGKISTRSYVKKLTYQAAVVNHYISSLNYAKLLGYEYVLITEYDYIYDDLEKNFLIETFKKVENEKLDGFYITCRISGIDSIFPVPSIIPVDRFINYCGSKIIEKPLDYIKITNFNICEEWVYNFYKYLERPYAIPLETFIDNFKNARNSSIEAQNFNPLFGKLNSGLYINKFNENDWIYSVYNGTNKIIKIDILLLCNNEILYNHTNNYDLNFWYFENLSQNIIDKVMNKNEEIYVKEILKFDDKEEVIEYTINKKNIETLRKLKWFYRINDN